ncbi:MAG: hypothetical protein NTZ63_05450 [Candidatus Omnitrophica bacterium]|nr:hypothetical protein [Candidatus Omnitrophota bacterium]
MKIVKRSIAISRIEQALLVNNADSMDKAKGDIFERVYFGEEFCERLLPSVTRLKAAKLKARKLGKKFTLLTPALTEAGLNKVKLLLKCLNNEDEVVINDYGLLYMLGQEAINPLVVGRLIGRNMLLVLNGLVKENKLIRQYLSILGPHVFMLEVDSFNVQKASPLLTNFIKFSFRSELFFWTVTRRCAFNRPNHIFDKFYPCRKECLRQKVIIRNNKVKKLFLLEGNKIIDLKASLNERAASVTLERIVKVYK